MDSNYRLCTEDNAVGEFNLPRCPDFEQVPLDVYANDILVDEYKGENQMAVTVVKRAKKVVVPVQHQELDEDQLLAIEILEATAILEQPEVKAAQDKLKAAKEKLAKRVGDDAYPAEETVVIDTPIGMVSYSAKTNQNKIADVDLIIADIGLDLYKKLATFDLKNMSYVSKPVQEKAIVTARTGSRKATIVLKK